MAFSYIMFTCLYAILKKKDLFSQSRILIHLYSAAVHRFIEYVFMMWNREKAVLDKCIVILYEIHDAIKFLVSCTIECSISEINYLDVFISKTGNKWNTTIFWKPQTGIICFMQPVTILRLLTEFYFIVNPRTCRICNHSTSCVVKMDYLANKYGEWE